MIDPEKKEFITFEALKMVMENQLKQVLSIRFVVRKREK